MNILLPVELARVVHQKVASGLYESPEAVMRAALEVLVERDQKDEEKLRVLRELIQEGEDEIERGEYHVFTSMEELLKEDS